MNKFQIEKVAKELKQQYGGKIFAFPVERDNPNSQYAFTMYVGSGKYCTYPELANDINTVAQYCYQAMNILREQGYVVEYEKDVRFVSYEAQMNAPNVTMRRLRNDPSNFNIIH